MKLRVQRSRLYGKVRVPPSKSYTHRALFLSSLANGESRIFNPLTSRDTTATLECCRALGAEIQEDHDEARVTGTDRFSLPDNILNVENSGTTLRFTTALTSHVPPGFAVITGDTSIRSRPMQPLLDALAGLGVQAWSTRGNGCAPIIVQGGGMRGGPATIRGDVSSQFISALLVAATKAHMDTTIVVEGKVVSRPYIDATLAMLKHYGLAVQQPTRDEYRIAPSQEAKPHDFTVPGDFSAAALLAAAIVVSEGAGIVTGLDFTWPQGDAHFLEILATMGVSVKTDVARGEVALSSPPVLEGGAFDLSDTPDLLPALVAVASRARTPVRIYGVEHARYKESDRVAALSSELSKIGLRVVEHPDGLTILGNHALHPALLDAHGDHRLFMALSAAALGVPEGCEVEGLASVDVSYPAFVHDLRKLGAQIQVVS